MKKKNKPITISEMDVQPISDAELQALSGAGTADGWSDVCECRCGSDVRICHDYAD